MTIQAGLLRDSSTIRLRRIARNDNGGGKECFLIEKKPNIRYNDMNDLIKNIDKIMRFNYNLKNFGNKKVTGVVFCKLILVIC